LPQAWPGELKARPDEEATVTRELDEQLIKYLTDAHSIEVQALAQLRRAPSIAGAEALAEALRVHLVETEEHERATRELLEARGAKPSRVKDVVMGVGGKGFLLFARLQPDTPGKLFAHALSFEGLELASYELLRRVAERASAQDVVEAAERIAGEERAMIETLESLTDAAVEASLSEHPRDDLKTLLPKYLADAHAIEEQAIGLLERAPKLVDDPALEHVFSEHLTETREHAELVQQRLNALGDDSSSLKDAAMRLGALNWGSFFQGHPDTPGKLAAFAYAFEHLEIGGYEQLRRVAERAGDAETAAAVETILAQEREAARSIAAVFDQAAAASLRAVGATS
jgi:ferritin-like metal-binding protein YciE